MKKRKIFPKLLRYHFSKKEYGKIVFKMGL